MIPAVAVFNFEYLPTIELIAFSYAISGCSFSMSEIHSDRKPFQRLANRLNIDLVPFFNWLPAFISRRGPGLKDRGVSAKPAPLSQLSPDRRTPTLAEPRASYRCTP